jgi:hypothetical protein
MGLVSALRCGEVSGRAATFGSLPIGTSRSPYGRSAHRAKKVKEWVGARADRRVAAALRSGDR